MKINVAQELPDLDGSPLTSGEQICPTCRQITEHSVLTFRLAAVRALSASYQDDREISGEKKVGRFRLALKLTDGDSPDLTVDDLKLIKDLVARLWGPVVVGRVWDIIDPPA